MTIDSTGQSCNHWAPEDEMKTVQKVLEQSKKARFDIYDALHPLRGAWKSKKWWRVMATEMSGIMFNLEMALSRAPSIERQRYLDKAVSNLLDEEAAEEAEKLSLCDRFGHSWVPWIIDEVADSRYTYCTRKGCDQKEQYDS